MTMESVGGNKTITDTTDGPRVVKLRGALKEALEDTLSDLKYVMVCAVARIVTHETCRFENILPCFPALQASAPEILRDAHGQVIDFLRTSQTVGGQAMGRSTRALVASS